MSDHRLFEIHLKKKVINDPVLGRLSYEEYDSEAKCNFDTHENICELPFNDVEIQFDGNVYTCCPGWNPASLGSILEHDLRELWSGERANLIRSSISDGSYRYCNAKTCPAMIAGSGNRIIPKERFVDPKRSLPGNIAFSVDQTCNLVCPSCRTSKIIELEPEAHNRALTILRKVFATVFDKPHDEYINMTFDGCGEIFFSPVYREIFETEEAFRDFDKWPNFRLCLCTNGVMMTEKIQKKYEVLFRRMQGIRISIDAGNKESYDKVRCGGDWDLLWDNLNYMYENELKNDPSRSWAWNVILQEDNMESIPDLVDLAMKYPENPPEIYVVNMLNWGTYSQEVFDTKAVWFNKSPHFQRVKEILALPKVVNYPKMFIPNL